MPDALTEAQARVCQDFLMAQDRKRRHVVVHVSGAHSYGFSSPDSDVDLKAVHVDPSERFFGFEPKPTVANSLQTIDDVDVDYTSNELAVALRGVLKGDGNMLERVMSPSPLRQDSPLDELIEIARKNLSLRYFHHYRGFATNQLRAFEQAELKTAKKVLYVLRTALTGAHLLSTHECVTDLGQLCDEYEMSEAHDLIGLKRAAEGQALPPEWEEQGNLMMERAFDLLLQAHARSTLPEIAPGWDLAQGWLIGVRRRDV